MSSARIVASCEVLRSPRVRQVEGMFDLAASAASRREWEVSLPLDEQEWNIGLIVGHSGAGKSTIARHFFGEDAMAEWQWAADQSVIDQFPSDMPIKEVTGLLTHVGFSSPPNWLRPFRTLSVGEQFRVNLARSIACSGDLAVVDEFTSTVDRQVAKVASCCVAKAVRKSGKRLVAVTCHYDVEDWLTPDWVLDVGTNQFRWRLLQRRPPIDIRICRTDTATWQLFRHYHYLSHDLHRGAKCFAAFCGEHAAAFCAMLPWPHPTVPGYAVHRLVTLPDFQGVGVGAALLNFVAALYRAKAKRIYLRSSHPGLVGSLARSASWRMIAAPKRQSKPSPTGAVALGKTAATKRKIASFLYAGAPAAEAEASAFAI